MISAITGTILIQENDSGGQCLLLRQREQEIIMRDTFGIIVALIIVLVTMIPG